MVYILTEKHKENLSKSHKGQIPWNKGLTKESDERIKKYAEISSKTQKGRKGYNKGKHWKNSKEFKEKCSIRMKGDKNPVKRLEVRKKLSEKLKGKANGMYGRKGTLSPVWRGGTSFEPYTTDWTKTLKRAIRERDKYICRICGKEPAIFVHHIDYDKKNSNSDNLITLCNCCHSKTNHNREYWIKTLH